MSYALASKKRKFHRVLDSISNPPKTPNPESASKNNDHQPVSELPTYPSIKRVRVSHGNEIGQSTRGQPVSAASRPSSSSSTSSLPNFVPWDRERFLERLETFRRVDRWSPKPAAINEVEWARRGWSCTDVMRVECVRGCGQSVVVKLPEEIDTEDGYDSDKVEERKQVPTIHRLPLNQTNNALNNLQSRYFRLASLGSKLPTYESIELPEGLDIDEVINLLPPEFFRNKTIQDESGDPDGRTPETTVAEQNLAVPDDGGVDVNKPSLILALFGWDVVGDASAGLAGCGACFRRLGLWMYKPKDDGNVRVYNKLDVSNEHLDYCPWINSKTQSGVDKKAGNLAKGPDSRSGWEVLLRTIRNKHRRYAKVDSGESPARESTPLEPGLVDEETRRAKDKEWWSRLRKVRQALNMKSTKKSKANTKP
ncbi:hypothetical protein FQN54_001602 [Arachnomyces sp. PD_36]|nr:hypothetical protein FQN54_001602 [Arachnomyces sp. PD_36]